MVPGRGALPPRSLTPVARGGGRREGGDRDDRHSDLSLLHVRCLYHVLRNIVHVNSLRKLSQIVSDKYQGLSAPLE